MKNVKLDRKKDAKRLLWLLLILVVCAALLIIFFVKSEKPFELEDHPEALLNASRILKKSDGQFPSSFFGSEMIYEGESLRLNSIPEEDQVPVYRFVRSSMGWNDDVLKNYLDRVVPGVASALGVKTPEYEVKNGSSGVEFSGVSGWASLDVEEGGFSISLSRTEDYRTQPIAINNRCVELDPSKTDQQILEDVSEIKKDLLDAFQADYPDAQVVRTQGSIEILYYDADGHYLNQFRGYPHTGRLLLQFSDRSGSGKLSLFGIAYSEDLEPMEEIYPLFGNGNRISLEEAEKYLENGYVYGGHLCRQCLGEEFVDFSEYDAVGYVYLYDLGTGNYVVPFYEFYKKLDYYYGEGVTVYAKTYVCAIELSGWKAYADNLLRKHTE